MIESESFQPIIYPRVSWAVDKLQNSIQQKYKMRKNCVDYEQEDRYYECIRECTFRKDKFKFVYKYIRCLANRMHST